MEDGISVYSGTENISFPIHYSDKLFKLFFKFTGSTFTQRYKLFAKISLHHFMAICLHIQNDLCSLRYTFHCAAQKFNLWVGPLLFPPLRKRKYLNLPVLMTARELEEEEEEFFGGFPPRSPPPLSPSILNL